MKGACLCGHSRSQHFGAASDHCRVAGCDCRHFVIRVAVGRPVGSSKPDSKRHIFAQRYTDTEQADLYRRAERAGYGSDIGRYIHDAALGHAATLLTLGGVQC
jgi:hypothetical protein